MTQIGPEALINCDNVKVFGIPGSYAESYASLNGIPFSPIIGGERLRPLRPQVDESIRCILVDVDKGILFEHRADERAQIASLSKIPLLLFVLKRIEEGEMSKESIVSFGEEVTFGSLGGSSPSANSTVRGRIDGSQRYLRLR